MTPPRKRTAPSRTAPSPAPTPTATPPRNHDQLDVFAAPLAGVQLVEASAGTGKTWTLTALHLRLLLETDRPIASILVVTFTEAAVAELRTRVRQRLIDARHVLEHNDHAGVDPAVARIVELARQRTGIGNDKLFDRVRRALAEFDDAPICTIHAFCLRALCESAFAARLPAADEILTDDGELRLAAVKDFWRREIATPALDARLAQRLVSSGASPETWEPLLREAQKFPLARQRWDDDGRHAGGPLDRVDADLQRCFGVARAFWQREGARARDALLTVTDKSSYKPDRIDKAHVAWQRYFAAGDVAADIDDTAPLFGSTRLEKKRASLPALDLFDALQSLLDARQANDRAMRAHIAALQRRMIDHAARSLSAAKAAGSVQTFQDLLTNLHARLHADPALVHTLRRRYPAALVDEFQDTDAVQLGIFDTLYRATDAPVFLVGDPKQAIYSFRGADLASYLRARGHADQRVWTLDTNQRSTPELLAALDAMYTNHARVFGDPRLEFRASVVGEAPRKTLVALRDPTSGGGVQCPLRIWALPEHIGNVFAARRASVQACADDIARTLHAARDGLITYDDRPLRGGDIAVLVLRNADGQQMRRALAAVGVASVELARAGVFQSIEAAEIECLLHAVQDPGHPGKLRAAIATTLLGGDAQQLAGSMRSVDDDSGGEEDDDVGDAAEVDAAGHRKGSANADTLIDTTLARLIAWRSVWHRNGIAAMLARVFDEMHVAERLLPGRDGERRMTNLLHLMELLAHDAQTLPQPQALLRHLGQRRTDTSENDETLLRLESDRQLVQIITVHRAKGLQYPIVYAPLLWNERLSGGRQGGVRRYHDDGAAHRDHDHGAAYRDQDGGTAQGEAGAQVLDFRRLDDRLDKAEKETVRELMQHEAFTESLRLVYVALTRAEHRATLVVDAHVRRPPSGSLANLRSALNWIVAGKGQTTETWRKVSGDAAKQARTDLILGAWRDAVQRAAPHASITALPQPAQAAAPARHDDDAASVVPRTGPGPIEPSWRLRSFSSLLRHGTHGDSAGAAADLLDTLDPALARGTDRDAALDGDVASIDAADEAADVDIDALSNDTAAPSTAAASVPAQAAPPRARSAVEFDPPTVIADDDILRFPRGPSAGDAIHAALERADFTRPDTWPAAAASALQLHPQRQAGDAQPMLETMLRDITATPIAPGLHLADVARTQRLDELEFDLPLPALNVQRLQTVLQHHGLPVMPLSGAGAAWPHVDDQHGYLRGFVDCVFEHRGRYHLADWKSNHLGDTAAHYAQPALAREIAARGYHLQHVLYAVALTRHLRRCLGAAQAQAAWGGAFVLFVRGIRPTWADAAGKPTGVFRVRLGLDVLDEVAACFG